MPSNDYLQEEATKLSMRVIWTVVFSVLLLAVFVAWKDTESSYELQQRERTVADVRSLELHDIFEADNGRFCLVIAPVNEEDRVTYYCSDVEVTCESCSWIAHRRGLQRVIPANHPHWAYYAKQALGGPLFLEEEMAVMTP